MYTFDLMKADLLINLAGVAIQPNASQSVTTSNRRQEVHCSALEEAKKLIMAAKPDTQPA